MSKGRISEKQQAILEFIKSETLSKGYPPSVREICSAVGLNSPATVHSHLNALENNGYIRRDPSKPRAIEIIDDEYALARREFTNIPLVGTVAAGQPILAQENIIDYFPFPVDMLPNDQVFMLKVKGDSMINAGIFNGDQVIVRQSPDASNGDIVVAMVDDSGSSSATVKTFFKEKGHIRLQPENPDMEPLIFDDVQVLGKVIGIIRMY